MRFKLLLFILLISIKVDAQSFIEDWQSIHPSSFRITYELNPSNFREKRIEGRLFIQSLDSMTKVSYYVFHNAQMDSTLLQNIHSWIFKDGCSDISLENIDKIFPIFSYRNYYYVTDYCQTNVSAIKSKKMVQELNQYIRN